jgi:hypothetical protein
MATEQGLRNAQGRCGFGKTTQLCHADKGFDLFEVHGVLKNE